MPNPHKQLLLQEIEHRFGKLRRLPQSNSLFVLGEEAARVYVRYSKIHDTGRTFFGLRRIDLNQLAGYNSFICLLTDRRGEPIMVTYADFEHVFNAAEPAGDGQYKVQLLHDDDTHEFYIAGQGRYNVDGYIGYQVLERSLNARQLRPAIDLQHCQVQTLLASIGSMKGHEVYVPANNRTSLDWNLCDHFTLAAQLPRSFHPIMDVVSEVDVIWLTRGGAHLEGLFEVEHSTPVYSGLLRFNDILLSEPEASRFFIVSNDTRRELYARQAARPTFRTSGLSQRTSFLEYANVLDWHTRLRRQFNGK